MRAIVDDALFAADEYDVDLVGLIEFAVTGRHIVLTEPEFRRSDDSAAYRWILQHKPSLRERFIVGLEQSIHAAATELRNALSIRISKRPDPTDPLSMSASAARALMSRPLLVIVENDENDGAFIRMMLPPDWRERFREHEAQQWIRFDSGGGLSQLKKHIERLDSHARQRAVAVFDSDAWIPDSPSPDSDDVRRTCSTFGVDHHQLRRRASENYLPVPAIGEWIGLNYSHRHPPHRCYHAYRRLSPLHRHHFNIKGGLNADSGSNPPRIAEIFASLPAHTCEALRRGFTEKITSVFHQHQFDIRESWLADDDLESERSTLVHLIFRRI